MSEYWQKIQALLERDRADYLEQLAQPIDAIQTATLRGRIYQIDELIKTIPERIRAEQ
jgi:hypothetical protein